MGLPCFIPTLNSLERGSGASGEEREIQLREKRQLDITSRQSTCEKVRGKEREKEPERGGEIKREERQ